MERERTAFLQIDALEYLSSAEMRINLGPIGLMILLDLLMFASRGELHTNDPKRLYRLTAVSEHVFLKHWPKIEPFFEKTEHGTFRLANLPSWLRVTRPPLERQNLTHLLPELVAFWGEACVYCGDPSSALDVEHIVPVARGGSNDVSNLTVACRKCNLQKRTQTAAEFGYPEVHDKALRRIQ